LAAAAGGACSGEGQCNTGQSAAVVARRIARGGAGGIARRCRRVEERARLRRRSWHSGARERAAWGLHARGNRRGLYMRCAWCLKGHEGRREAPDARAGAKDGDRRAARHGPARASAELDTPRAWAPRRLGLGAASRKAKPRGARVGGDSGVEGRGGRVAGCTRTRRRATSRRGATHPCFCSIYLCLTANISRILN
jgi:hypothetical protein